MKKALSIIAKVLGIILLVVYLLSAVVMSWPVQTLVGSIVGNYFSKEWGGKVSIDRIRVAQWGVVDLHHIKLIDPHNDTIFDCRRFKVTFHEMPVDSLGIRFDNVILTDAYYHLDINDSTDINLSYIINYFKARSTPSDGPERLFWVRVKMLHLNGVDYRMDLKGEDDQVGLEHGVRYKHQYYHNIHCRIKDICVTSQPRILCRIVSFDALERSGFHLTDLSADVEVSNYVISAQNMELATAEGTHLFVDATLRYRDFGFDPYCDSVMQQVWIKPGSVADMNDAAFWAPILWGVEDKVRLDGHVTGPVASMSIDSLNIDIDSALQFTLDGYVRGLPNVAVTDFRVKVLDLRTSYEKLNSIALPQSFGVKPPKWLAGLKEIDLGLNVEGTQSRCTASAEVQSSVGNINVDLNVGYDDKQNDYLIDASVESPLLRISPVFPNEWVSSSGFKIGLNGSGKGYSDLDFHIDGDLHGTVVRGVPVREATLEGDLEDKQLTLDLDIDDELISMSISTLYDYAENIPNIHLDAVVDHADFTRLHLIKHDSAITASTHIRANVRGTQLEKVSGNISMSNTTLNVGSRSTTMNNILLSVTENAGYKNLSLASDWVNFTLKGYVPYASLPRVFRQFGKSYIPTYYNTFGNDAIEPIDASFSFDMRWKAAYGDLVQAGIPVHLSRGTTLSGSYSDAEQLRLVLRADSVGFGSLSLVDVGVIGRPRGEFYSLQLDAENLRVGAPSLLEGVRLLASMSPGESSIKLSSASRGNIKSADIQVVITSDTAINRIQLTQGSMSVGSNHWTIQCEETLQLWRGGLVLPHLEFTDGNQSVRGNLKVTHNDDDNINLYFGNFSLRWIADQWLRGKGFALGGTINGGVAIRGLSSKPYLTGALGVDSCQVNDYMLGNLMLRSDWNAANQRINLSVSSANAESEQQYAPIAAQGHIDLSTSPANINLEANFDKFPLQTVTPLLSSFASRFGGQLHGSIVLGGSLKQLSMRGDAVVDNGLIELAPTGVSYRFTDTIHLQDHVVRLSDFKVRDPLNNILTINGTLLMEGFRPKDMDISVASDNFMLFSKAERSDMLSGLVMAAIDGRVQGSITNLNIDARARTNRGSTVSVPVDDRKSTQSVEFITFASPIKRGSAEEPQQQTRKKSPLNMRLSVEITPDLRLKLPMTFQQIAPRLTASGNGDVLVQLTSGEHPIINGTYELTSGNLDLELFSFITTGFTLDPGSSIIMPGDFNNVRFDIKASHLVHANLASLTGTTDGAGRTVNVEDVIILSGTLTEPQISFDLRFPQADKSVEEEVSLYFDRTNEREVLNQAMSLLITGQFASRSSASQSVANNASQGSYNLMASTLSSVLSNVVKVVDVNIGYQGETELTREQLDIDIRKEWDRIYFETTLGYGGETRMMQQNDDYNYNIVGDVLLGYKIKPWLHLFVFNRTNTNDYTRTELPYKQGAGVKLTRDFNRWGELVGRKRDD